MSHSVTITRTTTTTGNTSYIVINTGYLKTGPGLLKFLQLVLGIVVVGIIANYFLSPTYLSRNTEASILLLATAFMIGTFLLLLSCIISLSTGSILSKTIYEVVYHVFGGLALLAVGIAGIVELSDKNSSAEHYKAQMAASVICAVNGILYFISTYFANKSYRGM
ncbi:uncharacterized protein LOC129618795 isoform X2 [Condylostylus longicornis]|uniref:uncharacterized protein LOC129618795 isoform X2 n=1 Tax=Condylostylus longicornis TaxID=2530218 RepID=UPI00244DFE50|nr:uncharacterized protein LOC129618795 isoform X2 [Condylostylus longicornis]